MKNSFSKKKKKPMTIILYITILRFSSGRDEQFIIFHRREYLNNLFESLTARRFSNFIKHRIFNVRSGNVETIKIQSFEWIVQSTRNDEV